MNTSPTSYHGPGYKIFVSIWGALLLLTGVTVYAAQIDLGFFNVVVALSIATVKASLVTLIFMHLKYESWTFKIMVIVAFSILAIFIGLTFFDTAYRVAG